MATIGWLKRLRDPHFAWWEYQYLKVIHRFLTDRWWLLQGGINDEALAEYRELGDKEGIAVMVWGIGTVHWGRSEFDEALRCYEEALAMLRELGNMGVIGQLLGNIADVQVMRREWTEAEKAAKEAVKIARSIDRSERVFESLSTLCCAEAGLGKWDASLSAGEEAHAIADRLGIPDFIIDSLTSLADAHQQMTSWFDGGRAGDQPPLSRDDALSKAVDYATQAKELAEEKGMKGLAKKVDELLAGIDAVTEP